MPTICTVRASSQRTSSIALLRPALLFAPLVGPTPFAIPIAHKLCAARPGATRLLPLRLKHSAPPPCTPRPRTAPTSRRRPPPMAASQEVASLLARLSRAAPAMDGSSHKGQAGKLAVIGGSPAYTGAPHFSAMASMRAGGELASIFCAAEAADAIKGYSPDTIVYPGFAELGEDCQALDRMHAAALGPGLGREEKEVVREVLTYACGGGGTGKVLVVDADALWFLAEDVMVRRIIRDGGKGGRVLLTPNKVEMGRLKAALGVESGEEVAAWFQGGALLIEKGAVDKVYAPSYHVEVANEGALKRVGGQGDVLTGLMALFGSWVERAGGGEEDLVAAAVGGCYATRLAAKMAFDKHGRALLTSDVLDYIGPAVDKMLADFAK